MSGNDSEPGGIHLRTRTLGVIHPDEDTTIIVEHVYEPGAEPCEHCGTCAHDPGMVGLIIDREDEDEGSVSVLLAPEDALLLANRLTRGASLVLELGEDNADIEREAAKLGVPEEGSGA